MKNIQNKNDNQKAKSMELSETNFCMNNSDNIHLVISTVV